MSDWARHCLFDMGAFQVAQRLTEDAGGTVVFLPEPSPYFGSDADRHKHRRVLPGMLFRVLDYPVESHRLRAFILFTLTKIVSFACGPAQESVSALNILLCTGLWHSFSLSSNQSVMGFTSLFRLSFQPNELSFL